MNRIKYRIWNKRYSRFEYWGHVSKGTFVGVPSGVDRMGIDETCEKSEQYTGLKDKNGVEIYEGDRVVVEEEVFTVQFSYGRFILSPQNTLWNFNKACKIIGNIHKENK